MAGASIVVDIKAQITGYLAEIEKIKSELKKVDPGSVIGKGLTKTLELAESKLEKLTRNAEQRISSLGLLLGLFDLMHSLNDMLRSLGLGMLNVGLNDVFVGASEEALRLSQLMKEVQTNMQTHGKTFIDDLTAGSSGDKLKSIFADLKFDPKTMGIDEFVHSFKAATQAAELDLNSLKLAQADAESELARMESILAARSSLPVDMRMGKPNKDAITNYLGVSSLLDKKNEYTSRNEVVLDFLTSLRLGLEKDTTHTDAEKSNIGTLLDTISLDLLNAKDEKEIENVLRTLLDTLTKNTAKVNSSGITKLTGESFLNWATKLNDSTSITEDFKDKVAQILELVKDTPTGLLNLIGDALNQLLLPGSTEEFQGKLRTLVTAMLLGLLLINSEANKMDIEGKRNWVLELSNAVDALQLKVNNYMDITNTKEYQDLLTKVTSLETELATIKEKLGLELGRMAQQSSGSVNLAGTLVLSTAGAFGQQLLQDLKTYSSMLEDVLHRQLMMGKVEGIAQRWFSVYAAVRMVSKAFRSMKENVTKIDNTITEIAIVTDMSQSDLWRLMPEYTNMARKYGSTIEGVYQVSLLYYQQGLEQADVMALTELTLKMARISGLDYTDATNYMTNAIRSFKMEMLDALTVVDVYSALAASSASSTTELATAMSKTASSAAAVGSSFESTSAMLAVMIETTRESPENIGSALKSIISRYGELKENKTGIDEEGEEYSLNKVDTALQSVGISIHDAKGEFRDFDDVIMELSQSWDTIDKNTQRYIATVMAGNRQQSRFLALVSNGERLAELTETAENSEDASTLQVLKTMDSIAYKSLNLLTSLQSLYTDSGIENLYKGILDGANQVVKTFTDMPTLFLLPIPALASFAMNFISIANVVLTAISALKQKFTSLWKVDNTKFDAENKARGDALIAEANRVQEAETEAAQKGAELREAIRNTETGKTGTKKTLAPISKKILGAQVAGSLLNLSAGLISDKGAGNRAAKATLGIGGSALLYGAMGAMLSPAHPLAGALIGGGIGALMGVWQNIQYIWQSTEDLAKRLKEEAEAAEVDYKQKRAKVNSSEKELKTVKELAEAQYDNAEAREKYVEASNKLALDMPELVSYYDAEGNAIIDLANAYNILKEARDEANLAGLDSAEASINAALKTTLAKKEAYESVKKNALEYIDYGKAGSETNRLWSAVWDAAINANLNETLTLALLNLGGSVGALAEIAMDYINEDIAPESSKILSLLLTEEGRLELGDILSTSLGRDNLISSLKSELPNVQNELYLATINFLINQLESSSTEIIKASGVFKGAEAQERAVVRSLVADYLNRYRLTQSDIVNYDTDITAVDLAKENLELFEELDNSGELLSSYITLQFLISGKTWKEFSETLTEADGPFLSFFDQLKNIPEDSRKELNELFKNKERYSLDEFRTKLSNIITDNTELVEQIMSTQSDYFSSRLTLPEFGEALKIRAARKDKFLLKDTDATLLKTLNLSGEELYTIIGTLDRVNKMYESGAISKDNGQKFVDAYALLWIKSNDATQMILSSITDFSDEGLEDITTLINDSEELSDDDKANLIENITSLFGLVPLNLNTALKSYETKMAETTESYSKDMSSATKGMDYEAAVEMANKLNIDTSTEFFDVREGEMYLKDVSLIYDHYFGKDGISDSLRTSILNALTAIKTHLEDIAKLKDVEEITLKDADKYGIDLNTLLTFIKDFKESGLTELTDTYVEEYFLGKITNALELVNILLGSDALTRAIDSGKLEDIVKAGFISDAPKFMIESYMGTLKDALQSGDFSKITGEAFFSKEFKSKLPELKQTYDDAQSSVIDDMISGLDEGFTYIEGTEFNKELLSDLKSKGLAELTPAINGVSNAIIKASRDLVLTYLEGITDASLVGMTTSELREKIASLRADTYEKSNMGALLAILDNYDNIDEVAYLNLLDHWDFANVSAIFTRRADGTYKANLPKLVEAYRNGSIQLDDLTQEKMNEVVTKAIDDGMTSITSAADYTTKGTTKFLDMANFTKAFNEAIPGINAEITDLFSYDKDLLGYTLDTTSYRTYLEALKQLLISLGESTEYIDGIIENANKSIIDAIDVKSFMEAELKGTKEAPSKAREALIKLLKNANIWESGVVERSEDWRDYYDNLVTGTLYVKFDPIAEAKRMALSAKKTNDLVREAAANNFIEQIEKGGSSAVMALHALATILGKELTSEEIESAYLSQVLQLEEALDLLEYGIGSIVNGEAVTALQNAGYKLTELGGGNAVIDSIGDISEAYSNYYQALQKTNTATVAALNEAKAKVLETLDGRYKELKAIDALGDAAGMTYTTFASILSDAGIKLTDDIIEKYTESLGGGKMRIKDFASFARAMNWDYDSEEYTSAFKSYNDSLIERNKLVEKSVNDELKGLEDIKPGDWLNLTLTEKALKKAGKDNSKEIAGAYQTLAKVLLLNNLSIAADILNEINRLESEDTLTLLNNALLQYGATLSDGILRLADDANLIGIAKTLLNAVTFALIEISDDIKDMVLNIIDSYTDLIVNGIEGSLTNVQKSELLKKLKNIGIEALDTDFILGTDGLLLSIDKAIEAYTRLGLADVRSQKKIYKALNLQLKDNRTSYLTATSMLSNLKSMLEELTELEKRNNQADTKHIELLKNEIELLKEMQMYSLVNEDLSWNFMSNDAIPASIDNALNYFANWNNLSTSLNTWSKAGSADMDSFAAALKHVQEVADATGENFTFMGKLITAGGDAYGEFLDKLSDVRVWDSKSNKWVLNNKKLKELLQFDMNLGSKGLSQGLKDNVDAYVERNAEVLKSFDEFTGGLAEVYKTLHDYSQEDNGHAFEDFLDINGDFNYEKFMNQLGQHKGALDEFKKFIDKVKINNQEWDKAMGSAGTLKADTEEYRAMMAVMKMAMSENWDLESDYMAVAELLSAAGANMDVLLGDTIIHARPGATIIETKDGKNTKFIDPYGDSHDSIQEALDAINRHALEDYLKALGQYQSPSSEGSSTITIDGLIITVEIKDGKIIFKTSEGDEKPVKAETFDEGLAKLLEKVKQETKSEIASTATSEGWAAAVSALYLNAKTYEESGGHISAEARLKGLTAGLTTALAVLNAYNAAFEKVNTANGGIIKESNIRDFDEAIAAEFYASTGIKLDPKLIPVKMEDGMALHIADEMNMTQTAVDVMNGITQAFTATGEGSVTKALSSAIAGAFANEEGLEIPALEIKPESVSLAAETTPTVGDITVSADKITVEGAVEPLSADLIPTGEGTVEYNKHTVKPLPELKAKGKITWTNVYSVPDIANLQGEIHWKNVEDNPRPSTGGCFVGGTQIIMADLTMKNIEDILIGEQVIAYNDENEQFEIRTVNKSYAHYNTPKVLDITLSNGIVLGITPGHPILTTKGWKSRDIANSRWEHNTDADWLNIGDEVIGYFGNALVITIKEHPIFTNYTTYNIEVETCHTFLADGIVVHNAKAAVEATGNAGLAQAKGTLMGELGPELVVSGGRYFVVGQSGPEMVDLADDSIVFNHLLTKSLLEKGTSSTRGRAITNEQNAVAFATGSRNGGPAKDYGTIVDVNSKYRGASGVWDAGFKAANNAQKPGDDKALKSFLKELERWYNWLQKIAHIEKEISYEEALRSKYQSDFTRSGRDYFTSLKKTLDLLQDQIVVQKDLVEELKKYLEQRKQELENSPFSTVYRFDERGLIEYQDGAFENFSKLFGTNDLGIPYYTAELQYEALIGMGMEDYMKYDNSGQEIDKSKDGWQATAVQAFYDKMEKQREEMQKLHDDIMDGEEKLVELQDLLNQILQEIEDNQIEVENKVLKAVEENHQREIDELQGLRDAIEDSATKMIDGLSDALSKEQEMYNTLQEADELLKLQRQLAIIQRSGGSAAQIADLQEQIADKQLSLYFDIQQLLIDALQAASDAELERLDHQIDLMQETLDYQKEYGLLWNEVNTVLLGTPEDIAAFIKENTSDYWNKSATDIAKTIREDLFEIDRFKAYLDLMEKGVDLFEGMYGEEVAKKKEEKAKAAETSGRSSGGGSGGGSGGSDNGSTNPKGSGAKVYKVTVNGEDNYFDTKEAALIFKKNAEAGYGSTASSAYSMLSADKRKEKVDEYIANMVGDIEEVSAVKINNTPTTPTTPTTTTTTTTTLTNTNTPQKVAGYDNIYTYTDEKGKKHTGNAWYMKHELGVEVPKKASGGYVNHGIYELGELGTETILTASQTKVLRDNILSNRPDSLINLLKSYNEAYRGLSQSTYDSISNNSNDITIERAEVNLLIEKLADDYDSKRAANTIMDEMLRIASKTSANNSVRR